MAGTLVHDLEALEVNENAPIEVGSSQKYEWSVAAGSRFPDSVSCGQLLVGVTRLNSSLARLIFATSSDPSAHIPVLLAEDTTHSRIANKNLNHLPDCARTEYIKKHYVCVWRAGECKAVRTVAYCLLGRHPGAAQWKIIGVLRSCRGSSWAEVFLFSFTTRTGRNLPNYFSPNNPKYCFLNFP